MTILKDRVDDYWRSQIDANRAYFEHHHGIGKQITWFLRKLKESVIAGAITTEDEDTL
jgi:hypothetical protein